MAKLIFKNEGLMRLLLLNKRYKSYQATLTEGVALWEKENGKEWHGEDIHERFYCTEQPAFWLVKDDGIYLMPNCRLEIIPKDGSHVCYAEGYSPGTPDLWGKCREAVGGDDFVETIEHTREVTHAIFRGYDMRVDFTETTFTVSWINNLKPKLKKISK